MTDNRMDDPDILDYTQDVRQAIVNAFFSDGKPSTDPKEATILVKTLSDMDKQVFSKAKQKSLDREIDNNAQAQSLILKMFDHMDRNRDTLISDNETGKIPEPELDEGEVYQGALEQGINEEGYEEFNARLGE